MLLLSLSDLRSQSPRTEASALTSGHTECGQVQKESRLLHPPSVSRAAPCLSSVAPGQGCGPTALRVQVFPRLLNQCCRTVSVPRVQLPGQRATQHNFSRECQVGEPEFCHCDRKPTGTPPGMKVILACGLSARLV